MDLAGCSFSKRSSARSTSLPRNRMPAPEPGKDAAAGKNGALSRQTYPAGQRGFLCFEPFQTTKPICIAEIRTLNALGCNERRGFHSWPAFYRLLIRRLGVLTALHFTLDDERR